MSVCVWGAESFDLKTLVGVYDYASYFIYLRSFDLLILSLDNRCRCNNSDS